jgi:hypothetical protein
MKIRAIAVLLALAVSALVASGHTTRQAGDAGDEPLFTVTATSGTVMDVPLTPLEPSPPRNLRIVG